ncbi:hypothetical protein DIPPA_09432 [Diplonema papillatum]|nr:hypothetical protein DIPPA_09432 [Diplonema papillatum]
MAYLDDIHAMSESLRGLKAVAEVTTDFDGGVNAGKSFFYATNADAPGTLTVQGNKEGTGRRREWTVVQNVADERGEAAGARHNFQHELREAGRTMRYKEVVKTRASLLGIEDGIDGGATRDLLEKGAITGYQQGLVRAVIANAVHTGKRWEQATCRFCDAGVPEDEQHMWWDCVKWSDVRGAYPNVLARRPEMKPCMALCGVMPKDAMGLDFDECRELAAGMQLMCVEILLGRQRADGILEQDCRRKELKVSTYPWGWEPQRPTASQTINVDGARPDRNAWKDTHEMLLALAEWCSTKRWSETGKEASISYFELAVDFELHSGLTLTPAGTQRRQENIAQRQPKERWTVADTLPGEETAAFFDGGSRGNGTNGAVAGAGAVFYDKGVKQWEVEKPIAGRATNNVAEYVGFVSVLARLLRDPVPPTPRTIVVKGDSELVIGQIKGTKRCNETLRRYYDQAQNLLAKLHDRRTTIEPVHIPRELNKDADELSNRAMDTAQRQAAQAYSDSATAKGWAMRTALSRLGKIARVKAVHPALEMRVNHLTSLGGPILQGLNKRPQINNREAFEAVMRAFEVAAVRHVPKKMANKGRGDQGGHWEKAGVLTGSFRPQAHYPRGWQHSGEKWKARARHDRATHRRARGGGSRHLWDVLANAEKKKADAQRAGCRPGSSTNRPTAAAAAATAAATSREDARKDPRHSTSPFPTRGGMAVEPSPGMTKAGESRGQ